MGNVSSSHSEIRPPMRIHQIHGKNLTISADRLTANRHEGYSDGLFFGSRPVVVEEHLEITVLRIISEWNGSLRFGFTTHNPNDIINHPEGIPRYMCPDLIKRGGSYVETISHISLRVKDKIVFWIEPTGHVSLKVNEVVQKCQLHGINRPVWPVVDVYGNTVEVSFRSLQDNIDLINIPTEPRFYSALRLAPFEIGGNSQAIKLVNGDTVLRNQPQKAYAWNVSPLPPNTMWVLFVNEVDDSIGINLSLAILKMSPAVNKLPARFVEFSRNYGSIFENVYVRMMAGDELAICIMTSGAVMVAINGERFEQLGSVSQCQQYWVAVDMNCSIIKLTSVGIFKLTRYPLPSLPIVDNMIELEARDSLTSLPSEGRETKKDVLSLRSVRDSSLPSELDSGLYLDSMDKNYRAECVICLDSIPDNVFIPCGHICCCKSCADNLMNEHGNVICPTCREVIKHSYKVYF